MFNLGWTGAAADSVVVGIGGNGSILRSKIPD